MKASPEEAALQWVIDRLRPEVMTGETRGLWSEELHEWIGRTLEAVGVEPSFDLINVAARRHLEEFSATRIGGLINETSRRRLRASLVEGLRAGEDYRNLARRVRQELEIADKARSVRIARTEVLRSSNAGIYEAHYVSGVVGERKWIATPDDRVRDSHWALHGQEQPIDLPFVIPAGEDDAGSTAMHPGDFGIARQDIQCRCTTIAIIRDPEGKALLPADLEAVWKRWDREILPWERAAIVAFRRGFRKQYREVLEAVGQAYGHRS